MFSTWAALTGLAVAVVLIIKKSTPVYALALGALAGGLLGGGGIVETVGAIISGVQSMVPSILRIIASGVLAGALVKTGSAERIADAIVRALGVRFALVAIAAATLVVTAVGVFIDIAVITVAPVALAVGRRAGLPVPALLLAMVGGGKAGNVISPNPNAIAAADAFGVELTSLMAANIVPAVCALAVTVALSAFLARKGAAEGCESSQPEGAMTPELPPVLAAIAGPVVVVALLALRPLCGFAVDPFVALPAGGLASILACGRWRETSEICEFGLSKVAGVSILLIGTGMIAGIIKDSGLNSDMIALLDACHLPTFAIAPLSSVLLSGATASTTAGATIAAQTFSGVLTESGVPALAAAAMLHAGSTVLDALPHGSFFHATAGAVGMSVKDRLKLFPYGALVGATTTIASVLVHA